MDDTSSLMWAILFGSIGMGYILYGRKQHHAIALLAGIALCVFPYFTSNPLIMIPIALTLMITPKYLRI